MRHPALLLATAGTALTLMFASAAQAQAPVRPVTDKNLPTKAQVRSITGPIHSVHRSRAERLEVPGVPCGDARLLALPGRTLTWDSGPRPSLGGITLSESELEAMSTEELDAYFKGLAEEMVNSLHKTTTHTITVHRARSVTQARGVLRDLRAFARSCRSFTEDGARVRVKAATAPRGGQERVGLTLSTKSAGLNLRASAAFYRQGLTIVTIATSRINGTTRMPSAALVRMALRKAG